MKDHKKTSNIPEFRSVEDEAKYWDTHDLADHWETFQPVRVRVARNLSEPLTIRLTPETLDELRSRAREKGLGPTTLARMWVLERLQDERSARRNS